MLLQSLDYYFKIYRWPIFIISGTIALIVLFKVFGKRGLL